MRVLGTYSKKERQIFSQVPRVWHEETLFWTFYLVHCALLFIGTPLFVISYSLFVSLCCLGRVTDRGAGPVPETGTTTPTTGAVPVPRIPIPGAGTGGGTLARPVVVVVGDAPALPTGDALVRPITAAGLPVAPGDALARPPVVGGRGVRRKGRHEARGRGRGVRESRSRPKGRVALVKGQPALEKCQAARGRGQPARGRGQPALEKCQPALEKCQPALVKCQPALVKGQPALV